MNINSIIDAIKSAVVTEASADVRITNKSFFAELLGKETGDTDMQYHEIKLLHRSRFNREARFPVLQFILQCAWSIVTACISLLYWGASQILWLFSGERRDLRVSARFNAVIFIAGIMFYTVLLAVSITSLLKNVMFYNKENTINQYGAILMGQPLGIENYVYLFNTAQLWANTGIEISKGDQIEVTASGSFYGQISDLYEKSKSNDMPIYKWNNFYIPLKHVDTTNTPSKYFVYKHKPFGTLLFQIGPEGMPRSFSYEENNVVHTDSMARMANQMIAYWKDSVSNKPFKFSAMKAGCLFVAVNDIYLSRHVVENLKKDDPYRNQLLRGQDTVWLNSMQQHNPAVWFDDNIGEFLLNIRVTRHSIPNQNAILSPGIIFKTYRKLESLLQGYNLLWSVLIVLGVLLADAGVGIYIRKGAKRHTKQSADSV